MPPTPGVGVSVPGGEQIPDLPPATKSTTMAGRNQLLCVILCIVCVSIGVRGAKDELCAEDVAQSPPPPHTTPMPAPAAEDIVLEPTAPHTATMIFMHGLGDTGMGWEDPMQMIQARIPGLKVILPTAPKIPVTLNGGMRMPAWYDIRGLGARSNETCDGIDASSQRIAEMLKAVRSADPSKKVFLGGFSQGGAMTLFTGLQHPEELAGLVVLSGYLACPQKVVGNAVQRKTIPIVMCHGDADPVVRLPWAEESKNGLEQAGFSIDFNVYPGLPHSPNAEVLRKVVSFLQSQL